MLLIHGIDADQSIGGFGFRLTTPATGKSTTAKHLAEYHEFFRVAEVNELFASRPDPEPEFWYCERQIERCELATKNQDSVLDGDPFQTVWFSWFYPDRGFSDWPKLMDYFVAHAYAITLSTLYTYMHIETDKRSAAIKCRLQPPAIRFSVSPLDQAIP